MDCRPRGNEDDNSFRCASSEEPGHRSIRLPHPKQKKVFVAHEQKGNCLKFRLHPLLGLLLSH